MAHLLNFVCVGQGIPTLTRNMSSIAIELPSKRIWLVDCGAGTQHQMIKANIWIGRVDRIFITHLHGDHCYDIVGLLALRGMRKIYRPIEVVGPVGIKQMIETVAKLSGLYLPYKVHVIELEPEKHHDLGWRTQEIMATVVAEQSSDEESVQTPTTSGITTDSPLQETDQPNDWHIQAYPLDHRIACFGYIFTEKKQLGSFDGSQAVKKGVTGKALSQLATGIACELPDGSIVKREDCLKPSFDGRKIVILGDTHTCSDDLRNAATNADLMVHESTFEACLDELALRSKHSTTHMAAECAHKSQVKNLIITHFSARYIDHGAPKNISDLLEETKTHMNHICDKAIPVYAAEDFWSYEIPPKKA